MASGLSGPLVSDKMDCITDLNFLIRMCSELLSTGDSTEVGTYGSLRPPRKLRKLTQLT